VLCCLCFSDSGSLLLLGLRMRVCCVRSKTYDLTSKEPTTELPTIERPLSPLQGYRVTDTGRSPARLTL